MVNQESAALGGTDGDDIELGASQSERVQRVTQLAGFATRGSSYISDSNTAMSTTAAAAVGMVADVSTTGAQV